MDIGMTIRLCTRLKSRCAHIHKKTQTFFFLKRYRKHKMGRKHCQQKNLGRIQFLDLNHGRSNIKISKFDGFLNCWWEGGGGRVFSCFSRCYVLWWLKKAMGIAKEQFLILINFLRKYPLIDVKSHSTCVEQSAHKFRLQNRQKRIYISLKC